MITDQQIRDMSLSEYIDALNKCSAARNSPLQLCTDLEHWKGYDIHSAEALANYLDDCVGREREKGNIVEKNYVVRFQEVHVSAESMEDAKQQALQTFQDYPSARVCFVREWGTEVEIAMCETD